MSEENCATSDVTAQALQKHGLVKPLVQSLVNPTPHGEDGEHEGDMDYEEKLIRWVTVFLSLNTLQPNTDLISSDCCSLI
jgi:hypothetical protein